VAEKLPSHFIDLIQDTALKSFWRKASLINFLRRHNISQTFLATMNPAETKRDLLGRLFPRLEASEKGVRVFKQMAISLADQVTFPDLQGWEDSEQKITTAKDAVSSLKRYLEIHRQKAEELREREAVKKVGRERAQKAVNQAQTLEKLKDRLAQVSKGLGTQSAGYEFQDWFYDVVNFFEVAHRRPYVISLRQIDGSVTVEGTTYLVELKFTKEQADAPDVDTFLSKVNDKADNTMGIMVSMSGYSKTAIQQASGRKTPLILMDYGHVYLMLGGSWTFEEIVSRLRRHASQTANAFLPAAEFGG
jgi:Restriction endonuclease